MRKLVEFVAFVVLVVLASWAYIEFLHVWQSTPNERDSR